MAVEAAAETRRWRQQFVELSVTRATGPLWVTLQPRIGLEPFLARVSRRDDDANPFEKIGSLGWIRTSNPPVNSSGPGAPPSVTDSDEDPTNQ